MPVVEQVKSRKVSRLVENLRQQILSRQIKVGDRLPTQRELSIRFNVAQSTAVAAMARLEGEGLIIRRQGSGTFVTDRPHSDSIQTRTLEFVRPRSAETKHDSADQLFTIEACSNEMQRRGWKAHWNHISEDEAANVDLLVERFADARGLVAFPRLTMGSELVRRVHKLGVPAVIISMRATPVHPAPYPVIGWDRPLMGRMAAEHLISRGPRRIAFLFQPRPLAHAKSSESHTGFYNGFVDAVLEHQLPIPAQWLIGVNNVDEARQKVSVLLSAQDRPEALCLDNGRHAVAALEVAQALELQVPCDLVLMCCNGGVSAMEASVPISDVNIDWSDICEKIVELIGAVEPGFTPDMADLKPPVLVTPQLCVRASC